MTITHGDRNISKGVTDAVLPLTKQKNETLVKHFIFQKLPLNGV